MQHTLIDSNDLAYVIPYALDREELTKLCERDAVVGATLYDSAGMFLKREEWPGDRQRAMAQNEEPIHHRYWSRITESDIELACEGWQLDDDSEHVDEWAAELLLGL